MTFTATCAVPAQGQLSFSDA